MRVHRREILLTVEAARDAGLVGYDKDKEAPLVEQLDPLAGAVDPAEARHRPDIALVVIEHAVAIEKGGRPALSVRAGCNVGISSRARRPV